MSKFLAKYVNEIKIQLNFDKSEIIIFKISFDK